MRLQAHLTPENTDLVNQLLADVNAERSKLGLEPVKISHLVHEILNRVGEMRAINLCGVFLLNRREAVPASHAQSVAISTTEGAES